MRGAIFAAYEVWLFVFAVPSCIVNRLWYRGHIYQSVSARSHLDGRTDPVWRRREKFIDRLFFIKPGHCARAHGRDVAWARQTLEMDGRLNNDQGEKAGKTIQRTE